MPLHRDIFWVGRQWAVTGLGMQAINQKLGGHFDVEVARLWDEDWLDFVRGQSWFNAEDFAKGLTIARARYPEPPKAVPPPLPVQALLPASEPEPIIEPMAATLVEPERPAPPEPEPVVEPVTVEAIEPANPFPSFLQMSIAEHSGKLLRVWRVQRRPLG